MAGIGFRLQKYFKPGSILSNIQGTLYSVIISSGPWLISVLTIAIVSYFAQREIGVSNLYIFKSIICYSFAASLIIFGTIEMPLTRYIADQLYRDDESTFHNTYLFLVTVMVVGGSFIGTIFYSFFDRLDILIKISAIALFCSIMVIWLSMVFLSAAKNYHQIIYSFLIGGLTCVLASALLGQSYALTGYVLGYSLGMILTAVLLSLNIFFEFDTIQYTTFEFTRYFKKYNVLIYVGLFYYLGIWVDKFIFWFSHEGQKVMGLFYTSQYYDTAMFIAYLTIVPSLAIFLVQVETKFYRQYLYYFKSIERKGNLNMIEENVNDIVKSIRQGIYNLIKLQTAISAIIWYFAEQILDFLYLPAMMLSLFKYGLIGAYLQVLFLIINIILLYFLNHKRVLVHYFLFFVLNASFSYISTFLDFKYHGLGYLMSTLIVFIFSIIALNKQVKLLNFYTFMGQPIVD